MLRITGSGAITQSVGVELGEIREKKGSKSKNRFRGHPRTRIQTEMIRLKDCYVVIDREKKGGKMEYRLDVLSHEASFVGRSREEVIALCEKWLDTKGEQ